MLRYVHNYEFSIGTIAIYNGIIYINLIIDTYFIYGGHLQVTGALVICTGNFNFNPCL